MDRIRSMQDIEDGIIAMRPFKGDWVKILSYVGPGVWRAEIEDDEGKAEGLLTFADLQGSEIIYKPEEWPEVLR